MAASIAKTPDTADPITLGPIVIGERVGTAGRAELFRGLAPEGQSVLAWHWRRGALPGEVVSPLAHLIESLQATELPGLSRVVHGSVSASEALVAYDTSHTEALSTQVARGTMTPLAVLEGALELLTGLETARARGVPVGRWSFASVRVGRGERGWRLGAPGLDALPSEGPRPAMESAAEAAACAPEIASGVVRLEVASDPDRVASEAYALGATMFYALTGILPVAGDTPADVLRHQLASHARRLDRVRPALDRHQRLCTLVTECLERAAAARPQTLDELRRRLEDARHEAERLGQDAVFLPARINDTVELRRSRLLETGVHGAPPQASRFVQLAALLALIALLLFLLLRQVNTRPRGGDAVSRPPASLHVIPASPGPVRGW